ncbi:hypothetical protein [Hyphococcus sp.]|uniref:hypothetical protein n=1 Tax=Hyphococcus sp. TaxID=2038636 RepID=UPI00208263FF|nr:MAG: hypothetical protein DHS20C04_21330 [Marinicaulis sp.]
MTPDAVKKIVETQLGDFLHETKIHGLNLQASLVTPHKITAINRIVKDGNLRDSLEEVWVVFEEKLENSYGYKIVYDDEEREFGLLGGGLKSDSHPVILGMYGTLLETIRSM